MNALERYRYWLDSPDVDDVTKQELRDIQDNTGEVVERFYTELEFGTAGLRGILGAGDNRMNVYNVRKATEGLARFLTKQKQAVETRVCIAYDSRRMSDVFARETACVLAAHGIRVLLFATLHSVPQLSFAIRQYHCAAGVVITASHNPPKYNGYKVYWSHGGQVAPAEAAAITEQIRAISGFKTAYLPFDKALKQGSITLLGEEADEAYYAATETLLEYPALLKEKGRELKLVYTPLHGTGYVPVTTLLARIGVSGVCVVPEQALPDGNFPTVSAPNPENPEAFDLARVLAEKEGASVILATDPDADRLGVAVRNSDGAWTVLTGNQIGAILIHYILSAKKAKGILPKNGLVVRSIVSTQLADAICARFGVALEEVLTGFRFISERIASCEEKKDKTFLFGFEESYGFLAGGFSRDKDAICAAMLIAEACVVYRERGMTLHDALMEIYNTYGFYREKVKSYTLEGKAGLERIASAMAALRECPPERIAGRELRRADDLLSGCGNSLPKANVLRYLLTDESQIVVRPSGTEPKLKLYLAAHAADEAQADAALNALLLDMDARLSALLYGGKSDASPRVKGENPRKKGDGLYFD